MAVTIDDDGAQTYFGAQNHPQSELWDRFTDDQKTAGLAYAKRQLTRALGTEIVDETVDTNASYQPDYACYEQAMFVLLNTSAIPDGTQTGPKYIGDDGTGEPRTMSDITRICDEAKRWMDWSVGNVATLGRG